MNYLLDTNIWYRAGTAPETLPLSVCRILGQANASFGLCDISLWEIGKKVQLGKIQLRKALADWLKEAIPANIYLLPLTPQVVADAMTLPDFPTRDPADELIVATARVHNLILLTTDSKLKNYPHARIRYFTPLPERK